MDILFFNIWQFTTLKICPIAVLALIGFKALTNSRKIKPLENCQRLKLCRSGGNSPNLVTLDVTVYSSVNVKVESVE